MRFFYTIGLAFFLCCQLIASDSYKGYLITKDNFHLTGFIKTVSVTALGTLLEFTNDFGTTYIIHPALVKGFAFKEGDKTYIYLSRYYKRGWYFLQVRYIGSLLSLYEAPALNDEWVKSLPAGLAGTPTERFWIQRRNGSILPITRFGFRRKMRRYLGKEIELMDPESSKKFFRYRNLEEIVRQINEGYEKGRQRT